MEKERAFENIDKWLPDAEEVVGAYGAPIIKPVFNLPPIDKWKRFCSVLSQGICDKTGVEFFLQDYQFQRVWNQPDRYIELLKKAALVLSPDFSLYIDMPVAMQIYNHYRKHWCASYWQGNGIIVIPTISWSDKKSLDWCFDGEPENSIVAISSVGTQNNRDAKAMFRYGYDAMLERLRPTEILFHGCIPEGMKGNIQPVPLHYNYTKEKI